MKPIPLVLWFCEMHSCLQFPEQRPTTRQLALSVQITVATSGPLSANFGICHDHTLCIPSHISLTGRLCGVSVCELCVHLWVTLSGDACLVPQCCSYATFPHLCVSADVPSWLKSLRLHKYQHLFAELTYSEMLLMSEAFLKQKVSVLVPC